MKMGDDENACVRNIVKEIMRECTPKKIAINKNFLTYMTKLLLIDPNWGITDNFINQRENVQHFVKYVTDDLLTRQDSPNLVTIKIQFYFSCNLENLDYHISVSRKELKTKLTPLRDNICCLYGNEKETLDGLLKKIVYYITLISGMGNPLTPKVLEEAAVALRSILDEDELIEFTRLHKSVKYERLEQFAKIVAGIRLFNKDCDKGGEGIANLPQLLTKTIVVIKAGVETVLLEIMEKVNTLTTIVDECYIIRQSYHGENQMQLHIPEDLMKYLNTEDIDYLKDLLIFYRQYELIIRKIIEELDYINKKVDVVFESMAKLLKKIHETVYMRIAIPVGTVFPLFEQLYDIWALFQDQVILMSHYSDIMTNLDMYASQTHYEHYAVDQIKLHTGSRTDAQRLSATAHLKLVSTNPEIEVLTVDSIKNIESVELQYLGFCCWKLMATNGALIPGNPTMGIVRYQGKYYVFSAAEAFKEFCVDPDLYINHVLSLARKKPQLINFFQIADQLESVFNITKLVESQEEIKLCSDKAIQVEDHIEDALIDPNYRWNIWDVKRELIILASVTSAKTASTQSDKGSSKNNVRTQTYESKLVETQTMKDNYSSMPKTSHYIYGLRGRKDDKQFVITLTRPIEE